MQISVIIPVYNEKESLPKLLEMFPVEKNYEIVIVDDSEQDYSKIILDSFPQLNIKYIHRGKRLGLSSAVIDGFKSSSGEVLVCLDGDGSHPPEVIPSMVKSLQESQMVIASRYIQGGSLDPEWNLIRRFISRACCLLAAPIIRVKDPMSGYFAVKKEDFELVKELKPVSYKIALEIAIKGKFKNISEVPFHFASRFKGRSKVTFKVIIGMIYHLFSLYFFKIFR